jgi:osmotically-inducible protein OsmY/prolyl-tRNA editing enzyme YbaK/EbsC (Cys-tRNA(Pro) deacylase)
MEEQTMKTDIDLQQDIIDELVWEPSIDAAAIGVAVEGGVVTLTGHVPSFAEKWTAEHVAKRVVGVRAVANEITVRLPGTSERSDADIARAALLALEWDIWVPHRQITLTVSAGWIKLEGEVDTQHQKLAAEHVVRTLTGVKGVTNLIKVTPTVKPAEITTKIAAAFQRSAVIDARRVQVETHGGKVVLRGNVHAWAERETAERAAWAAPGVDEVENQITVQPALLGKDKLEAYLRANQVPFETQHHRTAYTAQDVAASEHLPGQLMAKVVIAIADGALVMLVLPATHRVDLVKVRTALGARELWLATEHEFANSFPDCEIGAMPPFGNLYALPVYVDQTLTHDRTIVFQASTHTDTMRIAYADFARLAKPTVVDVARSPGIAAGQYCSVVGPMVRRYPVCHATETGWRGLHWSRAHACARRTAHGETDLSILSRRGNVP